MTPLKEVFYFLTVLKVDITLKVEWKMGLYAILIPCNIQEFRLSDSLIKPEGEPFY